VDFAGQHFRLSGAAISPRPVQAELPIWIGGGSEAAIRRTARYGTGWLGGPETPEQAGGVVAAIRAAVAEAGRSIDEDHYGASFPFHFGRTSEPAVERAMEAYRKRTGRDPRSYVAVGDGAAILERIAQYIDAGVSKFVLRPMATGDEAVLAQTRQFIDEVLPAAAARWPKPAKDKASAA
jgi:alkanesulfonate monooxygenase SsuD/methylene tetrahydromethanopterin reductase-like flavin-dependent oxidoreductase (luciferase family)